MVSSKLLHVQRQSESYKLPTEFEYSNQTSIEHAAANLPTELGQYQAEGFRRYRTSDGDICFRDKGQRWEGDANTHEAFRHSERQTETNRTARIKEERVCHLVR